MIPSEYKIPSTFKEGAKYFLMEKKEAGSRAHSEVTFVSFSSTPVFVYIKNSSGHLLYVLREELFEKSAQL